MYLATPGLKFSKSFTISHLNFTHSVGNKMVDQTQIGSQIAPTQLLVH